jgi:anti-sigma factor RsiW
MNFDDETLMAYADGELDGTARAAVEAAMAADAALAERVARHHELRRRLQAAFEPVRARRGQRR